jgi:Domain of unknown function (DUF3846)
LQTRCYNEIVPERTAIKGEREMKEIPKKINILVVEPNKKPYVKVIPNTLEAEQEIVGGLIQPIQLGASQANIKRQIVLMCNEEGHFLELPMNRALAVRRNIGGPRIVEILGPLYLTVWEGQETVGLNETEIDYYSQIFSSFICRIS